MGPKSPDVHGQFKPQPGAIFRSPFGPFPSILEDLNIHDFCFPPENPLPKADYDLFIDAYTGSKLTLYEFYDKVCSLARAFRYDGPNPMGFSKSPETDKEPGEIMGIFSRNNIYYPVIVHACFRSELVTGGISPGSTPYELFHILRRMQATSLLIHESHLPVLREAVKIAQSEDGKNGGSKLVLNPKKIIVLSDNPTADFVEQFPTVGHLIRSGAKMAEPTRKRKGGKKLCFLFQSSGTSGLPKAMMISHWNAIHTALQGMVGATRTAEFLGVTPTHSTLLGVVPAYHSYGMILWILRVNLYSATNIMMHRWDLETALQAIEKYKITMLPLVPPLVRQIAQSPLTDKYDLSSVMTCVSGAAYLPPDVSHALGQKLPQKAPIPSGYGLSEAASIASPPAPGIFGLPAADPTTIGYLLPGVEGRIVDPDTLKDVPRGQKGELWARAHVVTPGYFQDAKATAELFTEPGWLRTGDLVYRDEWDRIHYMDRLKEMIKVKGLQVAATEVEDTLLDHPEKLIRDACVAGVDNGRGDGSLFPRAWVVVTEEGTRQGEEAVLRKLHEWVNGKLSRHKHLDGGIEIVDLIPRTPSGKTLRRQMRDQYHERLRAQQKAAKL
ncbi:4-coumarate-CoA ligase 2 [Eremomyces bilateralis CBS 781.70]|uniref:4-coumarate-CoA ligase 2 n=1 Tax=Eremomyces bilateralis CBS 781.70 TaxID=1392243 RepID=A0A6G1G5J8_9PEZI|nr:4-coumarate-CoA ligase 2 [Eremomyces bilateralis CBS 781.70]KAF1813216.1 4-coumarate-CoA ligase 2 [Eremomyces bilateralis CBS 781.70]